MLKCISVVESFGQADDNLVVDNAAVLMRVNAKNAQKLERKSSNDLLSSTRAYLKSYVLGFDGSDITAGNGALDNKIEQAMDLVKSHLMFAVREEVDILKEQIKSLVARNSLLEHENALLRQTASPETLALLQAPPPSAIMSRDAA